MPVVAVRHAAENRVLVGLGGQLGERFADLDSRDVRRDRFVQRAAVIVARFGLGIERVQMRRAAPHPDLNHRVGLGRRCGGGCLGGQTQPTGQQQAGEPAGAALQDGAPREACATRADDRARRAGQLEYHVKFALVVHLVSSFFQRWESGLMKKGTGSTTASTCPCAKPLLVVVPVPFFIRHRLAACATDR